MADKNEIRMQIINLQNELLKIKEEIEKIERKNAYPKIMIASFLPSIFTRIITEIIKSTSQFQTKATISVFFFFFIMSSLLYFRKTATLTKDLKEKQIKIQNQIYEAAKSLK